jgi:tRNA A-37 threonylcarbamoyl transferase component Bud32
VVALKTDTFGTMCWILTTMPKHFIKRFPANIPYDQIRKEARLQRHAAALGLAPKIIRCTSRTIVMEDLKAKCLADVYGDKIEDLPEWVKEDILDILNTLYTAGGIEYVDITPYNFIELDGIVWIIDFGHAKYASETVDSFLEEILDNWELKWNPDFA